MSKDELVTLYLAGRLSRRTFIRGLIATGVSMSAAVTYATVLSAGAEADPKGAPGGQGRGGQPDDLYGPDFYQGHENQAHPVSFRVTNPCNGERVDVDGVLYFGISVVETSSDRFSITVVSNYSGLSGVGRITGFRYRGGGTSTFAFHMDDQDFYPTVETFRESLVLAGPAKSGFSVSARFLFIVDADGHVRVDVDETSGERCLS
jgi:hypothetical protein